MSRATIPPTVDPLALASGWLEWQADIASQALGQFADWQQAAWSAWFDACQVWSPLPDAATSPWLPFWLRGGEQLA